MLNIARKFLYVLFSIVNMLVLSAQICVNNSLTNSCDMLNIVAYNSGEKNGTVLNISAFECLEHGGKFISNIICEKLYWNEPCKVFSDTGRLVTDCNHLEGVNNVILVKLDRQFMFPTYEIGHQAIINHITTPLNQPIIVETISESPKLFKLLNFFSEDEADQLKNGALSFTDDEFRLKRSSTGTNGYHVDSHRTSENAFDTNSQIAMTIKQRSFELLGMPYEETWADGLQILRYNVSTAYTAHYDYIDGGNQPLIHNFDSASTVGTNRYATILLYLTDAYEDGGGETVFPHGQSVEVRNVTIEDTNNLLYALNISDKFQEGSWERQMVHTCRTKLAVKPKRAEAILFYSQLPNGDPDRSSYHGGCPVLQGEKWAANLWVWNGPRQGYWVKDSTTGVMYRPDNTKVSVVFEMKDDPALQGNELFWVNPDPNEQLVSFGEILANKPISMNSFIGHRFKIVLGNQESYWTMSGSPFQTFILSLDTFNDDLIAYNNNHKEL